MSQNTQGDFTKMPSRINTAIAVEIDVFGREGNCVNHATTPQ